MRKASLALGIGVALMGFMGAASADDVPLPRPAPLPKTGLAASPESTPRPPAAIPGAEAPARAAPKPGPVVTAQVVATPAPPAITGDKPCAAAVIAPNGVPFDAKQRSIIDRVNAYLTSVHGLIGA